jgi:hypothetical protein
VRVGGFDSPSAAPETHVSSEVTKHSAQPEYIDGPRNAGWRQDKRDAWIDARVKVLDPGTRPEYMRRLVVDLINQSFREYNCVTAEAKALVAS